MKNLLALLLLLCFSTFSHLQAQTDSDEAGIRASLEKLEKAYNEQDLETIQSMFYEDAVRIDTAGQEIKGADKIAANLEKQFIKNNTTLKLELSKISWSDYQHALVAHGTYEVKGATIVYDIKIDNTGTFAMTMIEQKDGTWKIARMELSTTP